jgi:Uma2 family endonuclease
MKEAAGGAPDIVIEILSPNTSKRDLKDKFLVYERAGVKEYWIVSSHEKFVMIYVLKDGLYGKPINYTREDKFTVGLFPELEINLNEVFSE